MGQTDPVSFDKASADRVAAVVKGYEADQLSHKPRTRRTRDTTTPQRRNSVWVIIREVEFDDVTWIWIERAKPSDEYDTNGGLFVGVGPPDEPPEREVDAEGNPVVSDDDWAKILDGWQKMAVWPHRISQDYRPAVWVGLIVTREPNIFPAERIAGNWHVSPTWRRDVRVMGQDVPMGSCNVVQ